MDALVNYLTVGGFPAVAAPKLHTHVVGKDILKFHAVYWPAVLMALDLPLPDRILAHGHWTMDRSKMSKSKGNVVDPDLMIARYSSDLFRFFLLSEGRVDADSDFSEAKVEAVLNELANTLGNLQLRCTSPRMCPESVAPAAVTVVAEGATDADRDMVAKLELVGARVAAFYDEGNFSRGIEEVMLVLHATNQYFDHAKPWILAKEAATDADAAARLAAVIYVTLEAVRIGGVALQPVCPATAAALLGRLGCTNAPPTVSGLRFGLLDNDILSADRTPLFPKFGEVKR